MNKIKTGMILFILITAVLSGCSDNKTEQAQKTVKTEAMEEVEVWLWDETFNVKAARMAAKIYEADNPGVNTVVRSREREEILSDIQRLLSAKMYDSLPDVIMMEDYDAQGVLSSFDEEFCELSDKVDYERFSEYKLRVCEWDGKRYGIPFDSGATALFYRSDILEEAGYTASDMADLTWDEFIEIGRDVYQKTGIPMITIDPTDMSLCRIIMQSCGRWYVKDDGTTPDIAENDALLGALKVYEKLIISNAGKSVNGWDDFISAFQKGEVAAVITGCWVVSNIKAVPEQSGLWRATQIPVLDEDPDSVPMSNIGGSSWYVLKHGKNPEAAVDYVADMFGNNDEFMDILINEIGITPAVKNPAVYKSYEQTDPFFGNQRITKFLTEMTENIPPVNYGSSTYVIEDMVEEEYQNYFIDRRYEECLMAVESKAAAIMR